MFFHKPVLCRDISLSQQVNQPSPCTCCTVVNKTLTCRARLGRDLKKTNTFSMTLTFCMRHVILWWLCELNQFKIPIKSRPGAQTDNIRNTSVYFLNLAFKLGLHVKYLLLIIVIWTNGFLNLIILILWTGQLFRTQTRTWSLCRYIKIPRSVNSSDFVFYSTSYNVQTECLQIINCMAHQQNSN
jgi:hypothetical protein